MESYLGEALLHEHVALLPQPDAVVEVGELADSQAVGRVELPGEEDAAGVLDAVHLQQTGHGENLEHVAEIDGDGAVVAEVDEALDGGGVELLDGDPPLVALLHVSGEHGVEVGATGG